MCKQAQTIELSTELGINYIPCCSIVLMCYNGLGIRNVRVNSVGIDEASKREEKIY